MTDKIEISHKTIIFSIAFLIFLWFIVQIKEIIFLVFISFILMAALKPYAEFLEKWRIPRPISIVAIYICFFSLFAFMGGSILPLFVSETIKFFENLPGYINSVNPYAQIDVQTFTSQITPLGENILKVSVGLFGNIIALFSVFVLTLYMVISRKNLENQLVIFMGEKGATQITTIVSKVEERLGVWVRGQIALVIVIGLSTYIGLLLLNIPYALPLAILAGILEVVPTIGPLISAIPAVLIALTISPWLAVATTGVYFIIQQTENHLVVPLVMNTVVGVPPLATIIAIMIGAKLEGVGGAILAIPIVVTIQSVISEYMKLKNPN